jgi:uncharacterized protein YbbC (DUF1343 family)
LLETTNVSVGRGTDTPFELIGAPWLDGQKLAAALNAKKIAGVRFIPVRFTPKSSVFKNEECGGINVVITDRAQFQSLPTGIEIAVALHRLFPADWKIDSYARLLVNAEALASLQRGDPSGEVMRTWAGKLDNFRILRLKYLMYE